MSLLDIACAPNAARDPLLHLATAVNALRDMPPGSSELADGLVCAAVRDIRGWAAQISVGTPSARVIAAFCLQPTTGPASKILAVAHSLYEEYKDEVEDGDWTDAAAFLEASSPEEGAALVALYLASMRLLANYVCDADEDIEEDLPELERAVRAMTEGTAAFRAETGFLTRVRGNWERNFPEPYLHPRYDLEPAEAEARRAKDRERRAARRANNGEHPPAKKAKGT